MPGTDTRQKVTPKDQACRVVVGMGASAGGLEALETFFGAMPWKTGFVFVVVVHLDAHESRMPELLSRATRLTVELARDGQPLVADHVYVIPPNCRLTLDRGRLRVKAVADRRSLRGVIDHFFRSLAEAGQIAIDCPPAGGTRVVIRLPMGTA